MVYVLDQEVGPKGPQEHKLKLLYVASGCYKQHTWQTKAGSTCPPVQLTPLSPIHLTKSTKHDHIYELCLYTLEEHNCLLVLTP